MNAFKTSNRASTALSKLINNNYIALRPPSHYVCVLG